MEKVSNMILCCSDLRAIKQYQISHFDLAEVNHSMYYRHKAQILVIS